MPLLGDIGNGIEEAKKIRLPWWAVLGCIATGVFAAWRLDAVGRLDLALPMLNSIGVIGVIIALKRKLATRTWFWITIAVLAALHIPLVLFVPWPTKWIPALAIAAIDSVDLIVMLAVVSLVGNVVEPTA